MKKQFKELAVSSILATDMSKHNNFVDLLKRRIDATIEERNKPEFEKMFQETGFMSLGLDSEVYDDKKVNPTHSTPPLYSPQ